MTASHVCAILGAATVVVACESRQVDVHDNDRRANGFQANASSEVLKDLHPESTAPEPSHGRGVTTSAPDPTFDYPTDGIERPPASCKTPVALLMTDRYGSLGAIEALRQILAAHPELDVLFHDGPERRRVSFFRVSYGGKNFSVESEPGLYAIVAQCSEVEFCLGLAALIRAARPEERSRVFCGLPPAVSGGLEPLAGPWQGPGAPRLTPAPPPPQR